MANIGASNTPVARLIGSSPILGTTWEAKN